MAYLTENELVERFQLYTAQLESQLIRGDDFSTLADAIPFPVHLNDSNTLELLVTNRAYSRLVGHELEEIRELGTEFFVRCIHPESLAMYPLLLQYAKQETSSIFSFIHHVINAEKTKPEYTPVITFTKPTALPGSPSLCLSPLPHNFGSMVDKVNRVIEIDNFKLKHFGCFQQLTPREIEILRLLSNGFNNPQIAEQLHISRHTVETYRKQLRTKLDIGSFRDLMRYALAFDLISF